MNKSNNLNLGSIKNITQKKKECPKGKEYNTKTKRCVNECKEGYNRNVEFNCVKNKTKKEQTKVPKKKTKKQKIEKNSPNKIKSNSNSKEMVNTRKSNKTDIKTLVTGFKTDGMSFLEKLKEKDIENIIRHSNAAYYNTKTQLLTDNEFDIIKEYMERKYPENEILDNIGAEVLKNKVELPYEMPSMDKIKPDSNALQNWTKKYNGPYIISSKLDGVSGLYTTEGDKPKLYTRGNGKVGQDISYLLSVLKLPKDKNIVVRGEFIIPRKVFDDKYMKTFANARNLVSGIINSKKIDEKTKDMDFVVYEVIKPGLIPSRQMKKIEELGFKTVLHQEDNALTNEKLSDVLIDWRTNYEYEMDGIIVSDDKIYKRKSGNPDHAFAFKMVISDQVAEAKVVNVIWQISKNGYLKPKVQIEPVKLGGVTIQYATGFNAKFIESNKIGIGAIIQIIRSGDVIPFIQSVVQPAENAKMPTEEYHWTDTSVDIVLNNIDDNNDVKEKIITAFFTTLKVDGLSSGNVKRFMKAGYKSISSILKMSKQDFEKIEGFKSKMIEKVYTGIQTKVKEASLLDIMVASNLLGRGLGERKMKPIMEAHPDILTITEPADKKIKMLQEVNGIGTENAKSFVSNITLFLEFLKEAELEYKLNTNILKEEKIQTRSRTNSKENEEKHILHDKHVVMTKTRDKEIIEKLKEKGGFLDDNVNKNTFVLIVKELDDNSNKIKKAKELGIRIMVPCQFKEEYF
jgi:DNA ligase (NAD+)